MAEGGGEGWSGDPKHGISHLVWTSYFLELSKMVMFLGLPHISATSFCGLSFSKNENDIFYNIVPFFSVPH
jgi:hypothetical protein